MRILLKDQRGDLKFGFWVSNMAAVRFEMQIENLIFKCVAVEISNVSMITYPLITNSGAPMMMMSGQSKGYQGDDAEANDGFFNMYKSMCLYVISV